MSLLLRCEMDSEEEESMSKHLQFLSGCTVRFTHPGTLISIVNSLISQKFSAAWERIRLAATCVVCLLMPQITVEVLQYALKINPINSGEHSGIVSCVRPPLPVRSRCPSRAMLPIPGEILQGN